MFAYGKKVAIIFTVLFALTAAVIFAFSLMPERVSGACSDYFYSLYSRLLYGERSVPEPKNAPIESISITTAKNEYFAGNTISVYIDSITPADHSEDFEIVTDNENGRIIPNNDTEKYVDTVIELMNSSDTRFKLVQNGLNNCQRYSQQTICNRWKSLIESFVVSRQ